MSSFKRYQRGQFLAPKAELALSGLHKAGVAVPLSLLWCSPAAPCISQSKGIRSSESLQQVLFYSQATHQGHLQEDAVVTKNNETDSCSKAPRAKQQQSFTHDPFWCAVVSHWGWGNTCLMCAITHPALGNRKARFLSLRMDQQSAKGFSAGGRELTLLQRGQNKPPATSPVWLN